MKIMRLFSAAVLAALLGALPLGAQKPATLELEQVVNGSLIHTQYAPSPVWLADGESYSRVETAEDGGVEVVSYKAADEARQVLIPSSLLRYPESGKPLPVCSLVWSNDNKKVLIYNNTRRVWRYDTRGDYWLLDLSTGALRQLGKGLPESSLMFAKFSPDGQRVAYVSRNNIYIEPATAAEAAPRQLTPDGCDYIVNGTFDWVYEEEFSCRDGFRFSPDSRFIAYWQSDTRGTGVFDIINNVDSLYPTLLHFPYPKAGTTNSAVRVGYMPVEGGETHWVDLPGDARNMYIPRMEFIPGSNELFIQQMNREQNTNYVWTVSLADGKARNIFTEKDAAWLETNDQILWLDDAQSFTWMSERSGFRHLYRVSRDGKEIRPITSGNFDLIQIVGADLKKQILYFIASPDNATQRYLYSASLKKGRSGCERLSPEGQVGQHSYQMSPTGKWAVHSFSNAQTPPVAEILSFPGHKAVRTLVTNERARAEYAALGLRPKQFLKVKSDTLQLDAWMILPADFDSTKKYPMIVDVYGEPANSTVQDVWGGGDLWHQYLAQLGYVVVSIDNRGAAAPRGRAWRKCIYGEVGTLASRDQANGVLDLLARFPWLDPYRVGITGWSGGGSQTLNCMFRYPQVFSTGIAVAFVSDQRLYDTVYQERYMNTPQNNPEGYRKGSPITYVEGLKGNLLLIHGTGDDNVHYQSCEMLVNELVKHGKIFSQISYPMRSHSINERPGTTLHLRKTMADYWKKNL